MQMISNLEKSIRHFDTSRLSHGSPEQRWQEVFDQFLAVVDSRQRPVVAALIRQPYCGGRGLRMWLQALRAGTAVLPESIPPELIQVYIDDPEAVPLHDCAKCGLAVPVRPDRQREEAGEPELVYFATCPQCGGPTGRYAHLSNTFNRRGRVPEIHAFTGCPKRDGLPTRQGAVADEGRSGNSARKAAVPITSSASKGPSAG